MDKINPNEDLGKIIDLTNQPCSKFRCFGRYKEINIYSDIDGFLFCSICGNKVTRYNKEIIRNVKRKR